MSGTARVWTVGKTFTNSGTQGLRFYAGVGNGHLGSPLATTVYANPKVTKINQNKMDVDLNGSVTFTVRTHVGAKYLYLYTSAGTQLSAWSAAKFSTTSNGVRVWTVGKTFTAVGTKSLCFRAGAGNGHLGSSRPTTVYVNPRVTKINQNKLDVDLSGSVTFTVRTDKAAKYLYLYNSAGTQLSAWSAAKFSTLSSGVRVWTVGKTFTNSGTQSLRFRAGSGNGRLGSSRTTTVYVNARVKQINQNKLDVDLSGSVTFTVRTDVAAKYLYLYNSAGTQLSAWSAAKFSTTSNGVRVWTVGKTFTNSGTQSLLFRAGVGNGHLGSSRATTVYVNPRVTRINQNKLDVDVGGSVTFTVRTDVAAKYLYLYNSAGTRLSGWSAANYSTVSSGVRVWTVTRTFSNSGTQSLRFRAGASNGHIGSSRATTVYANPRVTKITQNKLTVNAFGSVTFTVNTHVGAKYLYLYDSADTLLSAWSAAKFSSVSGSVRVWTVGKTFSVSGTQSLRFRAGAGNGHLGSARPTTVNVLPGISGVTCAGSIYAGGSANFTVITDTGAQYLHLYNESGTKLTSWSAAYSTLSGDTRVWQVSATLAASSIRSLKFRASADGKLGSAASVTVTVLPVIQGLAAASSTVESSPVTVTAVTDTGASALTAYDSSGNQIGQWSSGSYSGISDGQRVWSVDVPLTVAGYQSLQFYASTSDGCVSDASSLYITYDPVVYRALLIGQTLDEKIGTYVQKDIDRMESMLDSVVGPASGQKYIVTTDDDGASKSEVLSLIQSAFAGANDNDVSLFFISTHGVSEYTSAEYDGALLCRTGNNEELLTIGTLSNALKNVPGKVIVILQACGSGAAIANSADARSQLEKAEAFNSAVIKAFSKADKGVVVNRSLSPNTSELRVENKFYVLTSAAYHQNAYAGMFVGWLTAGIGTSGSMPADTDSSGRVTLHEMYDYIHTVGDNYQILDSDDHEYHTQQVQVYPAYSSFELFRR